MDALGVTLDICRYSTKYRVQIVYSGFKFSLSPQIGLLVPKSIWKNCVVGYDIMEGWSSISQVLKKLNKTKQNKSVGIFFFFLSFLMNVWFQEVCLLTGC